MIPTRRHLEFARGYLALGLLTEAQAELGLIPRAERNTSEVLSVRLALHLAKKEWEIVTRLGEDLTRSHPDDEDGWISWGYALRELNRVAEALAVLLKAEPFHGETCALVHYNLACYFCLLGNQAEAARRLRRACRMERSLKATALADEDLRAMRDEIAGMK